MPSKPLHECNWIGCHILTRERYCATHTKVAQQEDDKRRGSAAARGYNGKWQRYSKWFLKQPGNQLCRIKGPRCKKLAECVDHITPPANPDDPLFWDSKNHQAACIPCNSWKGNRVQNPS